MKMGNRMLLHMVSGRKQPINESRWTHFALACANMDAMILSLDASTSRGRTSRAGR
ncbi:hypothetical protein KX816_01570 [Sphingosinicellaceae bacterium]|nr:hypothetical protein KX816_01570 [Sphingosinicellaceae bacterium]